MIQEWLFPITMVIVGMLLVSSVTWCPTRMISPPIHRFWPYWFWRWVLGFIALGALAALNASL